MPNFRTYRDAANYILKLPKKIHDEPRWQFAIEVLINAAERGSGWMAHRAMLKALHHGKPDEPVAVPRGKAPKKHKIVR